MEQERDKLLRRRQIPLLLLSVLIIQLLSGKVTVVAQDDGGAELDDSSLGLDGGDGGMEESEDGEVGTETFVTLTYVQQTAQAVQQMAVVIGVVFLVGFLFMGMIAIEKMWEFVETKYNEHFGIVEEDEEDPAALVGTFKRYKN